MGKKYDNLWHFNHMTDPRSISKGSNMPGYPWLSDTKIDVGDTAVKMSALKTLGVPYDKDDIANASALVERQAKEISTDLKGKGVDVAWDSEMVALIAYLQRLGVHPENGKAAWALPSIPETQTAQK